MTGEAMLTALSNPAKVAAGGTSLDAEGVQTHGNAPSDSGHGTVKGPAAQDDDDAENQSRMSPADPALDPVHDPDAMEIDGLEERFTRILNSDMISVAAPSSLFVPKDYSMQFDNLMNPHQVQMKLYEKRLKLRQLRSQSSDSSKKPRRRRSPRPGFDPAEIVRKRAIDFGKESSAAQSSTLSCDIHPIFRAENFHGCPDQIYDEMKPGLRLATLLLTQKVCSTYWHTLWFGERKICEVTSNKLSKPCFRIRKDVSWSATNSRIFSQVLAQQAERVHFYFHSRPMIPTPCFASMAWVTDIRDPFPTRSIPSMASQRHHTRTVSNGDPDTFQRGKICLHTDFYTVAKRLSKLAHPDPAAVLRYNFWLAICLCHEVAHFLEWVRRSMISSHGHEAFWYDDAWNEAGEAWERKMWGGRVEPVASRADCKYGIATIDWPLKRWDETGEEIKEQNHGPSGASEVDPHNIYWTIPMEFISMIQQQHKWDELADQAPGSSNDKKGNEESDDNSSSGGHINDTTFHIPRVGTRSIELSTLDLTVWNDEAQDGLISDDIDEEDTLLKRTFDGRIVKSRKKGDSITRQTAKVKGQLNEVIAKINKKKEKRKRESKEDEQEGSSKLAETVEVALEAQRLED